MADTIKIPGLGPVKKTWVYAGIGITAGILLWAYFRSASAGGGDTAAAAADADAGGTGFAQGSDASGYNMVYPPVSGGYAQYGYDVYGNPLPAPTGIGGGTITTNSDWVVAAESHLVSAGIDLAAATTALTRVLGGLSVTTTQRDYFMQAVGTLGAPPQGYPTPIKLTDNGQEPAPTTPDPEPEAKTPAAVTGLRVRDRGYTWITIDWPHIENAVGYTVWKNGSRHVSVRYSLYTAQGLQPGRTYRFEIRGINADGTEWGPPGAITATTKK